MLIRQLPRQIALGALLVSCAACAASADGTTATAATAATRAAAFREYTVPDGTTFAVTLTTGINSGTSRAEDAVGATLTRAVSIDGVEVLAAGSTVTGMVSAVKESGRVKGLGSIALRFTNVVAAGRGDRYDINATYAETANATKKLDATKIGIGAGAGAAIGGLLGGGSGAAKGAAIGGGAGTALVLSTKGKDVVHAAGATLTVTLRKPITVRLPIK
jgi:hypothetical protein